MLLVYWLDVWTALGYSILATGFPDFGCQHHESRTHIWITITVDGINYDYRSHPIMNFLTGQNGGSMLKEELKSHLKLEEILEKG